VKKKIINNCCVCNNDFEAKTKLVKTCGPSCQYKAMIMSRKVKTRACIKCGEEFTYTDKKAKRCIGCASISKAYKKERGIETLCACGCGLIVGIKGSMANGCAVRGKTYKEIYGNKKPKCGFQRGENNPMADEEIVRKLKSKVSKKDIEYNGIYFRSSFELETYKVLTEILKKEVVFEPTMRIDGKLYLPDFVVYKKDVPVEIYEVSGYASSFEESRERNKNKIRNIKKEYPECKITFLVDVHLIMHYNNLKEANVLPYYDSRKEPLKGVLYE